MREKSALLNLTSRRVGCSYFLGLPAVFLEGSPWKGWIFSTIPECIFPVDYSAWKKGVCGEASLGIRTMGEE